MKIVAQIQGVPQNQTPAMPQQLSFDVVVGLIAGCLGAVGLPKFIQAFAAEKVENVKSERRREDKVLEAVLEVNKTMMTNLNSNSTDMVQLNSSLVSEISLIRQVVVNNTNVMTELKDVTESLAMQSHENTNMIAELSETVTRLKDEVSQLTRKT